MADNSPSRVILTEQERAWETRVARKTRKKANNSSRRRNRNKRNRVSRTRPGQGLRRIRTGSHAESGDLAPGRAHREALPFPRRWLRSVSGRLPDRRRG